jgi:hypothetical protein|tara:strand:+ start:6362 stop:7291 length:930 start_codon:yes stop_codon:yes gene_type:complete
MVEFTVFKSLFDNKTHRRGQMADFNAFEKMLYDLSSKPLESKKQAQLISPAVYKPDTTRKNDNVTEWAGWCAVDVDDFVFNGELQDELSNRFGHYRFVCYSTGSSSVTSPKFRLVFPLTKVVPAERIKSFWYALQSELGELGDKQTKDLSRMYYIPAEYAGAHNFIFSNTDGASIDPDELIVKHPMPEKTNLNNFFDRLPDELQRQILEHRKSKLENTNINWTSYRDCPFFPRKLEAEYRAISNTGWYHKMYQIMVAIAGNAVKRQYPISSAEISKMCRELDMETGNWYENRPLDKEADRALEYVYKNL